MADRMKPRTLARFTQFLGPRDGALRTAGRQFVAKLVCARHGAHVSFCGKTIEISKDTRVIRIASHHFAHNVVHPVSIAEHFDDFFSPVTPVKEQGRLIVDYSHPKLHRYVSSGLEFELSSFPEEESALAEYFRWYRPKLGDSVFDVGAYCGVSSHYFSQLVGMTGKVYAFEPDPLNFSLLERNIERHKLTNVVPLQMAISDSAGSAEFMGDGTLDSSLGALGSGLVAHSGRVYDRPTVQVKTITFREACESYGVPVFVKIDIEGSEIAVLDCAAEFLKSHPTIHFTLDTSHVVNGELTNSAVEKIFQACDYEVQSSDQCGIMTTWARPAAISWNGGL
jgi:FkbM family methyltransferase